jgi:hypothetical protein
MRTEWGVFGLSSATGICSNFERLMMFDEQPDDDLHGECAHEIARLEGQRGELLGVLAALCNKIEIEGCTPLDWPEFHAARAAVNA